MMLTHSCTLALVAILVTGCASGATGPSGFDAILSGLQTHPLLQAAVADADRTLDWVYAGGDPQQPLDALDIQLAQQCPAVVRLAVADLQARIDLLQALHAQVERARELPASESSDNPYLIYRLTRFRWGAGTGDALGQFRQARADMARRFDAVVVGCRGLVPPRQLAELAALSGRLMGLP